MPMSFFEELRRRNVLRVAAAYVVTAWLLIQVADTLFPLFGFGEAPARTVVVVLAIGFLPVVILAWVFELTPQGLRKEEDVDRSQPADPRSGSKLDRLIMVVLAIAVAYFAFDKFLLTPRQEAARLAAREAQKANEVEQAREEGRVEALARSYGDKSIAVLPFVNMTDDPGHEYFSDGVSEELLNLLTKVPALRVISRSSSFSLKGQNLGTPEIARRLNVAYLLEGSVRKAGNRVRITAQLIEAQSDTHLWSETYDRTLEDIFAVQDEIAASVVEQLQITLLGDRPHARTTDPHAYALFLKARQLGRHQTADSLGRSADLYEQVLAIDPGYVAAWEGLARTFVNQANKGLRPYEQGYGLAREAAEKALAIEPDYAPAHSRLGWLAMDSDLADAAQHYERALELDPTNLVILGNASTLLKILGRLERSLALDEYVVARDPVNPVSHFNLGITYLSAGHPDEAIASFESTLRLSPGYLGAYYWLGLALLFKGEAEAAVAAMQQEEFEAIRLAGLAMAYHTLGQGEASDAALAELIDRYEQEAAYNIAYVLAYREEAELAFEWLNKAVEYDDPGLTQILGEPGFDKLRDDPRWLPFLRRVGYAPEQLEGIRLEITLPQGGT